MKAKASEGKKKTVNEFVKLMESYPIIGTINMENLPTRQLQVMRAQLRENVVIKMTKRRLMNIAIDKAAEKVKGIEKLKSHLDGMPAMLFTTENPFKLYSRLKKNKSSAPAKAGQVAPKDIVVLAGATNFAPGPIIGELGQFKIKAGIENGKVAIKQDTVVAKKGDVINAQLAGILTRLGIEPMEIGLNIVSIFEKGEVFERDVLDIDEDKFYQDFGVANSYAFNLAIFISYPTGETINCLLSKAHRDSVSIGMSQGIESKDLMPMLVGMAESQATALDLITRR